MNELKKILVAEDDPKDAELMLIALEEFKVANNIVLVKDGAEALDYLHKRGKYSERENKNPIVAFLDLKMPKVDGITVAREVKSDQNLKQFPMLMLLYPE